MSIKKRFVTAALSAGLICAASVSSALAFTTGTEEVVQAWDCNAQDGSELMCTLYADSTFTVYGQGNMRTWSSSGNIPWGNYKSRIKKVIIHDGVASIGFYAFASCANLTTVTIGSGITQMADGAFIQNPNLVSLTIKEGATAIGNGAFRGSGLTSVKIPNSVVSIAGMAFADSPNLTKVTIGDSLRSNLQTIDNGLVYGSNNVNTVTIHAVNPPVLNVSGHVLLLGISETARIFVPAQSVEAYDNGANWRGYNGRYEPITFTEPVTEWPCGTNVTCALEGGIIIVKGTGAMTNYVSDVNSALEGEIVVANGLRKAAALTRTANQTLPTVPWRNYRNNITSVVVEDGVTHVGDFAFVDMPNMTSVTMGRNVASIGEGAFAKSTALEFVTILNPVPPAIVEDNDCAIVDCPEGADCAPICPTFSFAQMNTGSVTLKVPEESLNAYAAVNGLGAFHIEQTANIRLAGTVSRANSAMRMVSVKGRTLNIRVPSQSLPNTALQIRMVDMRGKTVMSRTMNGGGALSLTKVPAGRYFVEVKGKGIKQVSPIILQ